MSLLERLKGAYFGPALTLCPIYIDSEGPHWGWGMPKDRKPPPKKPHIF